jgi:hypothetical protein
LSEKNGTQRGPWYLLTGAILGLIIGLIYSWFVQPVEYKETPPSSLRADYKDQYRLMISIAYSANGDLVRAQERLKLLKDRDMQQALIEQAQRILASEGNLDDARVLSGLASALEARAKMTEQPLPTSIQPLDVPATQTPTLSPTEP